MQQPVVGCGADALKAWRNCWNPTAVVPRGKILIRKQSPQVPVCKSKEWASWTKPSFRECHALGKDSKTSLLRLTSLVQVTLPRVCCLPHSSGFFPPTSLHLFPECDSSRGSLLPAFRMPFLRFCALQHDSLHRIRHPALCFTFSFPAPYPRRLQCSSAPLPMSHPDIALSLIY